MENSDKTQRFIGKILYRHQNLLMDFKLDDAYGIVHCFINSDSSHPKKSLILSGCEFPPKPTFVVVDGGTVPSFDIQIHQKRYSILTSGREPIHILKEKFIVCSNLPYPSTYRFGARLCCYIFRLPNAITNGVCASLEKIGERMNETPGWVFSTIGNDEKERKKRYEPGNIATGLAVGTKSIIQGVVTGLSGVVIEPIKGAKHEGIKGATLGLGRGILGLVCKPVAGTLDLVSYSVRGVNNMPKSLYRKIILYYRKRQTRFAKQKADAERFANLQDLAPGSTPECDLMPAISNKPLNTKNINEEVIPLSNFLISDIEVSNLTISPNMMLQTLVERNQKLYSLYLHISNRIIQYDSSITQFSELEISHFYSPSSYNYENPDEIKRETSKVKKAGEKLRVALLNVASICREKVVENSEEYSKSSHEEIISFLMSCGRDIGIDILDEDLHSIVNSLNSSFSEDLVRKLSTPVSKPKKHRKHKRKNRETRYSITEELYEKPEIVENQAEEILEEEILIEEITEEELPLNPALVKAAEWKPYAFKDDYRLPELCNDKGGIALTDKNILNKLRDAGKELIKTAGKKILRGDFNLTTVSFPIKCMQPRSVLHNCLRTFILNPLYINRAAMIENPLERMKLVVASTIGSFHTTSTFLKPVIYTQLNPYLGETVYSTFEDGTQLYAEQTMHHPPVTHFYLVGPNNLYKMYGYLSFEAKASLNSFTLKNSGVKTIKFSDESTIEFITPNETFNNTFFGTARHESLGEIWYRDKVHKLECIVKFGTKKKPTDYFEGCIIQDNKAIVSKCAGSYLGWLDFDNVRYWDIRCNPSFEPNFISVLPSDSDVRKDLNFLKHADTEQAQKVKEEMEEMQRRDRRLRETFKP